jgi:hypothetical protein
VKSVRAECLDHLFIFNEAGLRRVMASHASYFNHWRLHRSLGQRAPCDSAALRAWGTSGKIIAEASSANCITSISARHNGRHFCALQPPSARRKAGGERFMRRRSGSCREAFAAKQQLLGRFDLSVVYLATDAGPQWLRDRGSRNVAQRSLSAARHTRRNLARSGLRIFRLCRFASRS